MDKNKTKNRQRRKTLIQNTAMICFLIACMSLVVGVPVYNINHKADADSWYVSGGNVEIAARPYTLAQAQVLEQPLQTEAPAWAEPESGRARPEATREPVQPTVAPVVTEAPAAPAEQRGGLQVMPQVTLEPMETAVPEEKQAGADIITITAVGDCTLGGNVPSGGDGRFHEYVKKYGYDYFFDNVRDLFESDDLTIVNLEGPLTGSNSMRADRAFNFKGKTSYVKILSGSSVEICNVANNHSQDFGKSGLTETANVLNKAGIGCSGYEKRYSTVVKGVKVTSLGFTHWDYSASEIKKACRDAKKDCDLLIVSMHWGEEKVYKATELQRELGRAAIDAGADVVLGHHPHVIGGVDKYKGKYIVYSLGNFCFGGNGNPDDMRTMIFQQSFKIGADGSVSDAGINIIPASISSSTSKNNFQPTILSGSKGEDILKAVAKYSNLSMENTKWMEDSYMVKLGYASATPEPASEPAEAAAEDNPETAV